MTTRLGAGPYKAYDMALQKKKGEHIHKYFFFVEKKKRFVFCLNIGLFYLFFFNLLHRLKQITWVRRWSAGGERCQTNKHDKQP